MIIPMLYCAQLFSHLQLIATSWTVVHQPSLSMGILQARILEWVACFFLQGIFPTQASNPGLLHCRPILYHLSHQESLIISIAIEKVFEKIQYPKSSQGSLVVKNQSASIGDARLWVQSLCQEDLLEKDRVPTPASLPGKSHG